MNDRRYQLYVWWSGAWRRIFGSDSRRELEEYQTSCPDETPIRIVDTHEGSMKTITKKGDKKQ